MKREIKYYFAIGVFAIAYLIASFYLNVDTLSKRVSTLTTIIAAVAFWLQFKRTERLNEANYIMNLNSQFINNKSMTQVEHELELYYNKYEELRAGRETVGKEAEDIPLGLNLARESEDCQKLIDYLAYMEALAAIVERNVIHLDVIDNLFVYRFFVAINNPVVQKTELIPYADFYQGCYWLSEKWTMYHEKDHLIPMKEFGLKKASGKSN